MAEPSLDNLLAPPSDGPLTPPDPVPLLAPEQAVGLVPVDPAVLVDLDARARAFVDDLLATGVRSPAFAAKVDAIATMGQADLRAGGRAAQRMLQRTQGPEGTARVTANLAELRRLVAELHPDQAGRFGRHRPPDARTFARYEQAQSRLDAILRELVLGQDDLRRDNAAIATEQAEARAAMAKLSEYATLATALEAAPR